MLLDLSAGSQNYIEDCEVCCYPLQISFDAEDGEIVYFDAVLSDK